MNLHTSMRVCVFAKRKDPAAAELWVYGDIGSAGLFSSGVTAKDVADALKKCAGAKTLSIYVSSVGGDAFEGMAIYNLLRRFPAKKRIYVDGLAASAASLICMAAGAPGDKIVMTAASMLMIHEASGGGGFFGPADEIRKAADDMKDLAERIEKINGSMAAVYAARSGQSEKAVRQMMADETWMTAKEAIASGFADEQLDDDDQDDDRTQMRAVASASPLLKKYRNVPSVLRAIGTLPRSAQPAKRLVPYLSRGKIKMKRELRRILNLPAGSGESQIVATVRELLAKVNELQPLLKDLNASTVAAARTAVRSLRATAPKPTETTPTSGTPGAHTFTKEQLEAAVRAWPDPNEREERLKYIQAQISAKGSVKFQVV
jgi:ATP-dependent Clp protease protease subunit